MVQSKFNDERRFVLNERKSFLKHSCDGSRSRKKNYKKTEILALPSPQKVIVSAVGTVDGLDHVTARLGLPNLSRQVSLGMVRLKSCPSDERLVLETMLLPGWFKECREADPEGTYKLKTSIKDYNGLPCTILKKWLVSMGIAKELVGETVVLGFVAFDGGHLRNLFGGVVLVAALPTANRKIFPLMFAWVESEDEENVKWFTKQFYKVFPSFCCVWMNDQGSAILAEAVLMLRKLFGGFTSICSKHVNKTLIVNRNSKDGEIRGSLKGIEAMVYQFAHSRTDEFAASVLEKIKRVNPTVAAYLKERQECITAGGALKSDFSRGGRITSQLAESFMNFTVHLRQLGHISFIIGLIDYLIRLWNSEKAALAEWRSPNRKVEGVDVITPNMSRQFQKEVMADEGQYVVVEITRRQEQHLVGVVTRKANMDDTRVVEIRFEDGKWIIDCPCLLHQDYGWPCGRALRLIRTACEMYEKEGDWNMHWTSPHLYAPFMHVSTWEKQLALHVTPLPAVSDLEDEALVKTQIAEKAKMILVEGEDVLLPPPIKGHAGRPKKRKANQHFRRKRGVDELAVSKQGRKIRLKGNPKDPADSGAKDDILEGDDDLASISDGDLYSDEEDESDSFEMDDEDDGIDSGDDDELEDNWLDKDALLLLPSLPETNIPDLPDIFDEIRRPSSRKQMQHTCQACGGENHNRAKCQKPNIEFILDRLGVIPKIETEKLESMGGGGQDDAIGEAERSFGTQMGHTATESAGIMMEDEYQEAEDDFGADMEKEVSVQNLKRPRPSTDTGRNVCVFCQTDTVGDGNWRYVGNRLTSCGCFIHFRCQKQLPDPKLCPFCDYQPKNNHQKGKK